MKQKIHLIRHGMTEGNIKGWYYGFKDIPLDKVGRKEVKKYCEQGIYPRPKAARYITSGMKRTEETFRIIYGEREHEKVEGFKEINFGVFEGYTHEELKGREDYQKWIDDHERKTPPPNGESAFMFLQRIHEAYFHLLEMVTDEDTVLVCHGGVIAAILQELFPHDMENFYQWIPDPGKGFTLSLKDKSPLSYKRF